LEENRVILKIDDVDTFIGKSHILQGVSVEVNKGSITALLGRNGVGKSTTLKSVVGITPPHAGSVRFRGREMRGLRPYAICRQGIGFVPEERRIFPTLTVRENLLIGLRRSRDADKEWTIDRVYDYFPQLKRRDRQRGGNLSGGEQQMLSIGRTLVGNPDLLLVDEPTEGLSPLMVDAVLGILRQVNEEGKSVLLVEHSIDVALELASQVYVMSKGAIVFGGTPQAFRADEGVRKKYLEV
jgi:branched-chain amino acid transport system ATP-binding protein